MCGALQGVLYVNDAQIVELRIRRHEDKADPRMMVTVAPAPAAMDEAAEVAAELPKLKGTLWHAYRRTWATTRKGEPVQDVPREGGWKDLSNG